MRALVISGGGSKGAFAGGVAEYLIRDMGVHYDILVGSSTGSLLVPQLAIEHIDEIKKAYTRVTADDIYNVCPFKVKRKLNGEVSTRINILNAMKMIFKGRRTFGEHYNLLNTIRDTYSKEEFTRLQQSGKKVIVTVANLSLDIAEYKYASDHSYEDFTEWMWISTSFVPFMSLPEKNGFEYADGGLGTHIPIEEAISAGAKEIDVIILHPRHSRPKKRKSKNVFEVFLNTLQFMHGRIAHHNTYIGLLQSLYNEQLKVNFIFTPRELTTNSFHFDPEQMTAWWQEGYEYAQTLPLIERLNLQRELSEAD